MKKPIGRITLKRSIIVGIVFLFLSTAYFPVVSAGGKADLIVTYIGIVPYGDVGSDCAAAEIKNIGDAEAVEDIYVDYVFTRILFRTVPRLGYVVMSGGLDPGDTTTFFMIYERYLPKFGFFEFRCAVNPDFTIDESNYDNNDLSQKYVAFLGQWKKIG